MTYTIKEAAERTGLSAHTIRYYDKEGLLPNVARTPAGARMFEEKDFEWMHLISCLKNTGMPIRGIRDFVNWYLAGDSTLRQRLEMFLEHRKDVERQIEALQTYLEKINHKVWYYGQAVEAGTIDIHRKNAG